MLRDFRLFTVALMMALPAAGAAQEASLVVRNGDLTVTLTARDLASFPAATVAVSDPEMTANFEGVLLNDVLRGAGVTFGQAMRGPRLATYLVAAAADGYRVVIALPEIDPDFTRAPVPLIALRRDGKPLSQRDGPLQLVLPGDKRHARWVRQLTSLVIHTVPETRHLLRPRS